MKKIGMIGGLSWVSTAEYYKRTNEIMQQAAGGVSGTRRGRSISGLSRL